MDRLIVLYLGLALTPFTIIITSLLLTLNNIIKLFFIVLPLASHAQMVMEKIFLLILEIFHEWIGTSVFLFAKHLFGKYFMITFEFIRCFVFWAFGLHEISVYISHTHACAHIHKLMIATFNYSPAEFYCERIASFGVWTCTRAYVCVCHYGPIFFPLLFFWIIQWLMSNFFFDIVRCQNNTNSNSRRIKSQHKSAFMCVCMCVFVL